MDIFKSYIDHLSYLIKIKDSVETMVIVERVIILMEKLTAIHTKCCMSKLRLLVKISEKRKRKME